MTLPHVLIGECTSHKIVALCRDLGWGRMWVFRNIRPIENEQWGFDCGAFKAWSDKNKGIKDKSLWAPMEPGDWDATKYSKRLARAADRGRPYLAVCPDLPGNGARSLAFSLEWHHFLFDLRWPLFLAVQDGMNEYDVDAVLGLFDGIFLGGSPAFKLTAPMWCALAHRRGKRFHYARCSSARQWNRAVAMGADSVDSSQALWSNQKRNAWVSTTSQGSLLPRTQ